MYDVIIIGAGPAGLTSAIFCARANKNVLVLEAKTYGGQILSATKIDNYPGMPHTNGVEFSTNLYNQVIDSGVKIVFEKAIRMDNSSSEKIVFTENNEYKGKSIIIATGSDKKKLGVAGEEKLLGKGISYCATCDGMFFKEKNVAVVGGGDTALKDVEYLSDICSNVYLIHRRNEFRGGEHLVSILQRKSNVNFILNSTIAKINGEDLLESIDIQNNDGTITNLEVNGLFIAIGQVPETGNLVMDLEKNNFGYIIAGEDMKTNIEGVFVAGDVREKKLRQLTTAVGDGSLAAIMACNFINGK